MNPQGIIQKCLYRFDFPKYHSIRILRVLCSYEYLRAYLTRDSVSFQTRWVLIPPPPGDTEVQLIQVVFNPGASLQEKCSITWDGWISLSIPSRENNLPHLWLPTSASGTCLSSHFFLPEAQDKQCLADKRHWINSCGWIHQLCEVNRASLLVPLTLLFIGCGCWALGMWQSPCLWRAWPSREVFSNTMAARAYTAQAATLTGKFR